MTDCDTVENERDLGYRSGLSMGRGSRSCFDKTENLQRLESAPRCEGLFRGLE